MADEFHKGFLFVKFFNKWKAIWKWYLSQTENPKGNQIKIEKNTHKKSILKEKLYKQKYKYRYKF